MILFLKPPPIDLGSLPWDEEVLIHAVFANHQAVTEAIDSHPGREITERLESLTSVRRLFNKTVASIEECIARFERESRNGDLLQRNRKNDLSDLEENLQETLYIFAATSMTLVDQSRALAGKVQIPEYEDKIARTFSNSYRHRFVQELRVDMIHVTLHGPNWQINYRENNERTARFLLQPSQLRRLTKYHRFAAKFVQQNKNGIDIGLLARTYSSEVNEFQDWLCNSVSVVALESINDYARSQKIVRAVSLRSMWRIILSQVLIKGKRDPYVYLPKYLTKEEYDEVVVMPHRSKIQVDRIIEMVDDNGACNDEVREMAYKAFGV